MTKPLIILGLGGLILGGVMLGGSDDVSASKLADKYNKSDLKSKYVLEDAKLVKKEIKNAEKDKYTGEPKDEVKVTIGGDTEFTPDIELKRWNEVSFKLKTDKLLKNVAKNDKKVELGDRVKFKTPKMDFEMYEFTEGEGGFKYVWYLNEKPATNKIEFEIESEGLDFFYQPPLNEEYPQSQNCSPTECDSDNDGTLDTFRPIEAVGSYAVYHKTKGKMNDINGKDYKVGKAFHIYRPHLVDANGLEAWGNLHIGNGIYSVEIPQEFLDSASYPIKSNDTFGDLIYGASNYSGTDDFVGSKFTAPANMGTFVSMSADKVGSFESNWKGVITDATKTIIANGVGDGISPTVDSNFNTLTYTSIPTLSASTDYYLGLVMAGINAPVSYDSTGGISQVDDTNSYTTPQNPNGTDGTRSFTIYATYSPESPPASSVPVTSDLIIFE